MLCVETLLICTGAINMPPGEKKANTEGRLLKDNF